MRLVLQASQMVLKRFQFVFLVPTLQWRSLEELSKISRGSINCDCIEDLLDVVGDHECQEIWTSDGIAEIQFLTFHR